MKRKVFLLSLLVSLVSILILPKDLEGDRLLGYPVKFLTLYDTDRWTLLDTHFNVLPFVLNAVIYFFILLVGLKIYSAIKKNPHR